MAKLHVESQAWPIRGTFTISRGSKTAADVVYVALTHDGLQAHGECVPYARYGESSASVIEQIESQRTALQAGLDRSALQQALPAGAARNALDCALWDLDAKRAGRRAWELAGLSQLDVVSTAYTLSLETPGRMRTAAAAQATRPLIKVKLGGAGDLERVRAVRAGAPDSRLIVDANEGWSIADYEQLAPELASLGVALIEQPLPAGQDADLASIDRPVPVCADESCHDRGTLNELRGRYDVVNIKLDKTGGLTEALALRAAAREAGMGVMVGCMLATSLAMAPALLPAQGAEFVDLDGPLLLERDRDGGLRFEGSNMHPPEVGLWG